jgi:hypothetical protein
MYIVFEDPFGALWVVKLTDEAGNFQYWLIDVAPQHDLVQNQWFFFALTYDANSGETTLWKNDEIIAQTRLVCLIKHKGRSKVTVIYHINKTYIFL